MYISEQLLNPSDARLRLSTQLGVEHVVLDNRGTSLVSADSGGVTIWDAAKLRDYRRWVEGFGLTIDVFALDVGAILLDSLVDLDGARKSREILARNIAIAADVGITCLKYNVQMVGITRTGLKPGRGGCSNSGFCHAEYSPESDRRHSYWGVGYPTQQDEGGSNSALLCGQQEARGVPPVSEPAGWDAIEFLVEGLVPAADAAGVRLACHPHDPAYPVGGLNGIEHVMGSADGMRRFLALSSSPNHGLNFCQGTVAEMFKEPAKAMIAVIEEFASTGRIFMVHFRNIRGGYLDFQEVFPDEGDVDMAEAIRAYQRGGYRGPLCPDHVPVSELDPGRERFMAFALGYTRGLLHVSRHPIANRIIDMNARALQANPLAASLPAGVASTDRIEWIELSLVFLPLATPISDAKVLTGRQKPLTEIAFLFCELQTKEGHSGIGFSYSKRAGGPGQYVHAKEIAPTLLGEDPNDIARLWDKLCWAGASVGRSGLATQAIAAFDIALWDCKAKRAKLPLAKLLGAHRDSVQCYNTSGGYLSSPLGEVLERVDASLERGIGGIKIKVGQPDPMVDLERVRAVHQRIDGRVHMMIDANQQWDRVTAQRFGRAVEELSLTWIEEPLDAYDAEGHAALAAMLDTPIATGEMLTSVAEHWELIRQRSVDFIQPDAPRVGGITPMLKIMALADQARIRMAPHFAMEIHLHLSAAYAHEPWVEHFEWLEPMFNERLQIEGGRMQVPNRPGLGFSLSEQARRWTRERAEFGRRP